MDNGEYILQHRYDYDYLVCFKKPSDCKNPIGRIFGHVFMFRNVSAISSIRIEPTWHGTLIVPYTSNVKVFAKSLAEEYTCYSYTSLHEDFQKVNLCLGCTCVSMVKNILGIRKWFIFTPAQLEKYINRV